MSIRRIIDRDGDGKIRDEISWGTIIIVAIVVVLIGVAALWGSYVHRTTDTTTVTGKERVCSSNGDGGQDCKYLVYTERGTYMVADSFVAWRFNTSDVYGRIKPCHEYEITSFGWRLPAFSTYPNIDKLEDLGRVDGCEPS